MILFLVFIHLGKVRAESPIADAAEAGKWETVQDLLKQGGIDLNKGQVDGMTGLHWAVFHEHTKVTDSLLRAGADPNVKNRYGVTPLAVACTNGNSEIVKSLLENGADPNAELPSGETPIMTASRTGKVAPVELLLRKGANLSERDRQNQCALMWAAAEGHAEVVSLLIKAGANPNRSLRSGFTPMLLAARNGKIKVVKTLLDAGIDVNLATAKAIGGKAPPVGTSALRIAVENGHFELAVELLEAGADPDDQRSGFTPLHVLTWVRKPNRGDGKDGAPPPIGSGDIDSLRFAKLLISKYKANPNEKLKRGSSGTHRFGTNGATPFLMAAKTADLPYLKLLHELGADPTFTNRDITSPLLAAAGLGTHAPTEEAGTENECLEVVEWLLSLGQNINHKNRRGDTAMHGAAYKNLPKMVGFLVENGADIDVWNQKNKAGRTPLLIAQGFRPGNFKPAPETREAIENAMIAGGVTPPPAPPRPVVGKERKYEP